MDQFRDCTITRADIEAVLAHHRSRGARWRIISAACCGVLVGMAISWAVLAVNLHRSSSIAEVSDMVVVEGSAGDLTTSQ